MIQLGVKTDPIETRYSFEWLFDLLADEGVPFVQLGSFFELYWVADSYFIDLRRAAEERGLRVKSVFTAHRELGGFFPGDPRLVEVARHGYERLIHVAGLVGADYCGSNPGAIYRDRPATKAAGLRVYLEQMRELGRLAHAAGLKGLTVEPMSCLAEPPTTPAEIDGMMGALRAFHAAEPGRVVPYYLCGDISHGLADAAGRVVHGNLELFLHGLRYMAEFHFKNTDALFNSTFGFAPEERARGIVDLVAFRDAIARQEAAWPVADVVGYLEIGGPKIGRDYSDPKLGQALRDSLRAIKEVFPPAAAGAVERR